MEGNIKITMSHLEITFLWKLQSAFLGAMPTHCLILSLDVNCLKTSIADNHLSYLSDMYNNKI